MIIDYDDWILVSPSPLREVISLLCGTKITPMMMEEDKEEGIFISFYSTCDKTASASTVNNDSHDINHSEQSAQLSQELEPTSIFPKKCIQ